MARRVGFGRKTRDDAPTGGAETNPTNEAEIAVEAAGQVKKKAGPVARIVIIIFILCWLALWSYGISEAWDAAKDLYATFDWDAFDIAMLAFFAVWLTVALIGWAFGVVILFLMLFGKEVDRSPAERAERMRRWRNRRKGRRSEDDA